MDDSKVYYDTFMQEKFNFWIKKFLAHFPEVEQKYYFKIMTEGNEDI